MILEFQSLWIWALSCLECASLLYIYGRGTSRKVDDRRACVYPNGHLRTFPPGLLTLVMKALSGLGISGYCQCLQRSNEPLAQPCKLEGFQDSGALSGEGQVDLRDPTISPPLNIPRTPILRVSDRSFDISQGTSRVSLVPRTFIVCQTRRAFASTWRIFGSLLSVDC